MDGLLAGADLGSRDGDSLEKLTRRSEDGLEVAGGDDWLKFSLSTEPATGVDGGGCCLLQRK